MTQIGTKKVINIRVAPDLWRHVRILAAQQNISMREFVERALDKAIKEASDAPAL